MSDRDIIQQAYASQLAQLFATLFAAQLAADDPSAAEARFQQGVTLLRQVRDKALAQLVA
jgi:hypothetical protein